jgi:hypothetical protein
MEPPAGVEPAPRPYKGRVLAVDTTEARVETVGVEPTSSSLQARRSPLSYVPERVRTDGVEPPQREAPRLQRGELTLAQRPLELVGGRPGSNRRRRGSQPRVLPLHHGHHESGDDRTRTGGLSPDKRVLCSSELRPRRVRGWDSNPRSRAHEAREDNRSSTAQSGWQESNLRSPAPEAGGVASLPYSQKQTTSTPGGIRTRSFRVESPASSPFRPQGHEAPAAGLEPASRG